MKKVMAICNLIGIAALLVGTPAVAQTGQGWVVAGQQDDDLLFNPQQPSQTPIEINQAGRTAGSSVGQVGERHSRDAEARRAGVKPMERISSRIQNRVQSRIRNRIDRNYDPLLSAADPFAVAADESRTGGRPQ